MDNSRGYKVFSVFNAIILTLIAGFTLFPFLNILATSLSSIEGVLSGKITIFPIGFTLDAYQHLVEQETFWSGYGNTLLFTVSGTIVGLVMSIMCAYPLAQKQLLGKEIVLKFIVFTMFFNGGLIPTYLLIAKLGWTNKVWSIIIPNCINAYNVLIMRSFFQSIPEELKEAARIDGLNHIGVLTRIILPVSKPIIATMTLFIAVFYWNEWFTPMIYLHKDNLHPVTLFLRNVVMGSLMAAQSGNTMEATSSSNLPQTLQGATIILITIPIVFVYPAVQKYFVKGVMIGSIKG